MKKYLKYIGQVLTILSLVYIVLTIRKMGLDFSMITNIPLFAGILTIGLIGKTASVFLSGYVWSSWVFFFAGIKGNRKEGIRIYTKANTGKYLPGNVMHYVERNLFADKMGVGQKKVAVSTVIEVLCSIMDAFLITLIFSYQVLAQAITAVYHLLGQYSLIVLVSVVVLGIVFVITALFFLRKKTGEVLKEYRLSKFLKQLAFGMAGQAIGLLVLGAIFAMLYIYMSGNWNVSDLLVIVAGYVVAWVLGFVVPGAPGGVGIREMVLTLICGPIIGQNLIVTIALIHRLITVVGDFLAYILGIIFCTER